MEKTLQILNELKKEGIIEAYAIAGATALLFYTEPALTFDLDIFIFLPHTKNNFNSIISLSPIYNYLTKKGYPVEKEHVIIENIPVQFIPTYNKLTEEALQQAREHNYKNTKTWVISLEYLLAIMIDTSRPKDQARVSELVQTGPLDKKCFSDILKRYNLKQKWENKNWKI